VAYTQRSARWRMPAFYYTFTVPHEHAGEVQIFALDTTSITENRNAAQQIDWLRGELSRSKARWKIVLGHHPIFSNGEHGDSQVLINQLFPLLEQFNVDIYLSGHDHDLQILQPVNGVYQLISGAGSRVRDTLCRHNTIYAAGLLGFMGFRISYSQAQVFVVLDQGIVDYAYVIKKGGTTENGPKN
jgi:acid phosphatase